MRAKHFHTVHLPILSNLPGRSFQLGMYEAGSEGRSYNRSGTLAGKNNKIGKRGNGIAGEFEKNRRWIQRERLYRCLVNQYLEGCSHILRQEVSGRRQGHTREAGIPKVTSRLEYISTSLLQTQNEPPIGNCLFSLHPKLKFMKKKRCYGRMTEIIIIEWKMYESRKIMEIQE